jgi:hypothetical protein
MGLDDAQKVLIKSWSEQLISPASANLSPSPLAEGAKPGTDADRREDLAVRPIELLHGKGVLSYNHLVRLLSARIL